MKKTIYLVLATAFFTSYLLTSCSEGPLEKKGRTLDKKFEDAKDSVLNKGPAQKAGEKVDKAVGNTE